MKSCFGYLRVSSKKQGEGTSLDAQQEAVEAFALRNDITITKWFVETVSAAKKGRPEFNAMIKALRLKKADGMVMHKIDRSARNFFDWAKIGELSDAGVDVHFATESLDFRSRGGRLAANVQMAVAEDYCRNLREEVRKGQAGCLKQGFYPFSAPIGYLNNGKGKLKTLDPVRAPIVRQAFELYASGQYSTRTLRLELNKRGLKNHRDNPISKGCLEKFLKNPFYTGVIRIRKTGAVYQGAHKPLISVQLFETVQNVRTGKSGKKVTRHNHTYRGLFRCDSCQKSMIPERQKGHVYYRCHIPDCAPNSVREECLEDAVSSVLARVQISDEHINVITKAVKSWGKQSKQEDVTKAYAMRLQQNENRLEKLTDAVIDELIDKETFSVRKERLLMEQARLREAQAKDRKKQANPAMVKRFLERIKNLAEHYLFAEPQEKRQIVEIATSNRRVAAKNVYLEPSNWLLAAENVLGVFSCADVRASSRRPPETRNSELRSSCADDGTNSRRLPELRNQQLAVLAELSQSDASGKIEAVFAGRDVSHTMKR